MASTTVPADVKIAKTPNPPTFATIAEERLHRKQRLASAFRLFAKFGFSEGVAGHITARDPELHDHFWVNPFGMHFAHIRVSDLILVNEQGTVVEGNKPVNEAAFAIHSRLHTHIHSTARLGLPSDAFSIRLPRMLAPSTKITASSTTTPASCMTCPKVIASPSHWDIGRPSSCKTTEF